MKINKQVIKNKNIAMGGERINKVTFAWHIHHDVLVEELTEPIENRIEYIKKFKPKNEVKLRLKLLKVVKGELPKEFVEAWQKYYEAWQKYYETWQKYYETWQKHVEARQKYYEAWQKYVKVYKKYESQILALHEKECPNCSWNGKTIFSKEVK